MHDIYIAQCSKTSYFRLNQTYKEPVTQTCVPKLILYSNTHLVVKSVYSMCWFHFYLEANKRGTSNNSYILSKELWCDAWQTWAVLNGFVKNQLLWGATLLFDVKNKRDRFSLRNWTETDQLSIGLWGKGHEFNLEVS